MKITTHKKTLSMDSQEFTIKGVTYRIIETAINEFDICVCTIKDIVSKTYHKIEHQALCRKILKYQKNQEQVKQKQEIKTLSKHENEKQSALLFA